MKVTELLEYIQRRKSPEEREALKSAPDYWRKKLRQEFTKFNQEFGIMLLKSERFDPYDMKMAVLGGEYNFLVSGDSLTLPKEKRFELWKKAYAKKIHELVAKGYRVLLGMNMARNEVKPEHTAADIVGLMDHELKSVKSSGPNHPLRVRYTIYVQAP